MKSKFIMSGSLILSVLLLFSGCQKEVKEQTVTSEIEDQFKQDHEGEKDKCRLIFSSSNDAFSFSDKYFHYNKKGLCDVWTTIESFGTSVYNQQYNAKGQLTGSEWNYEGELITTIKFTYKNDRIVKETWYYAGTNDIYDETWYTYDRKGQIVRDESFLNDWYSTTKYSPEGNVLSGDLFFGGSPYFSYYYSYTRPVKNPNKATPGIPYFFPYYTPTYASSKFYNAAEKEVFYEEDGTPVVMFDYDPRKTIWQVSSHNYARSVDCYDKLSGDWFNYSFEFENCGSDHSGSQTHKSATDHSSLKNQGIIDMLRRNPKLPVKEQFRQLRNQLRNIKNSGLNN